MAIALCKSKFVNEKGKVIRKYLSYKIPGTQLMLWDRMDEISVENYKSSVIVRRDATKARVIQYYNDTEHFNEHHNPGTPIVVETDFTKDIEELKQSEEYHDSPPEDLFGESE